MPFDPSQPFESVDTEAPRPHPAFDPGQPFEPVTEEMRKPRFDPQKPFETVGETPIPVGVQRELDGAAAQQNLEAHADEHAPQWLKNAADAAVEVGSGLIPRSAGDVAKMLTPLASVPEEGKKVYQSVRDIIGGMPVEDSLRKSYPENFELADALKTPAYSKERFQAGFNIIAQMAMAAGVVHGMPRAGVIEAARPAAAVAEPVPAAPEEFSPTGNAAEAPILNQSLVSALADSGLPPEEISSIRTVPQAMEILSERRKAAAVNEPIPPRETRELTPAEIADAEYRQQLLDDARATQSEQGMELSEAIADAGGLPAKASEYRPSYDSEISQIESAVRNPERVGEKLSPNRIFRNDAPDLDELATRLRDRGFDFQTPADLLDAAEARFRTGREHFGLQQPLTEEQAALARPAGKPQVLKSFADLPNISESPLSRGGERRPAGSTQPLSAAADVDQASVTADLTRESQGSGSSAPPAQTLATPARATLPRRIQNPVAGLPVTGQPRSLADIRKYLTTALDIPARLGTRVPGGVPAALGLYRVKPQTIRLKALNDIPTLAHEIGHDLHHIVFDNPVTGKPQRWAHAFDNELLPMGQRTSSPNYTRDQVRMEGVAEFTREYLTDRPAALASSPNFFSHFETTLRNEHPEIFQILDNAREQIAGYIAAPGWEKAKSMIRWDAPKPRTPVREWLERQYTNWFDQLRPIQRMMGKLTELGLDPAVAGDVSARAINYKGGWRGKADHDLRFELTDLDGKRRSEGLHEIVGGIQDLQEWDTYLALKRAQEKSGQGLKTGFEDALSDPDTAKKLQALAPMYEARRQKLIRFSDGLMQNMEQSGFFTRDRLDAMRAANRDYVPFHRIYEAIGGELLGPSGGGQGFVNLSSGVNRFKGSDLQITSPTEAIVKNTYLFRDLAERNRVGRAFVEAAEKTLGGGRVAESVLKPMKPTQVTHEEMVAKLKDVGLGAEADRLTKAGVDLAHTIFRAGEGISAKDGIFRVWIDGKEKLYHVGDEDLLRALQLTDSGDRGAFEKLLKPMRFITGKLRAGATLSPDFILRNLTRDPITAAVFSRNGFIPGYDSARALFSVLRKDEWYRDFLKSGASNSGIYETTGARNVEEALHGVLKSDPSALRVALDLANPLNVIKNLRTASELIEASTRVGEFRRAIERGKSPVEAANDAKDVTLNFSRWGKYGRAINSISAFFNAGLQDIDKLIRVHREAPGRAVLKSFLYITAPSVTAWWLGKDDPVIQNLPEWRKSYFWNLNMGAGGPDSFVLSVPKPFLLGAIYGTGAEKALDWMYQKDPNAISKWGSAMLQNTFVRSDLVIAANAFKPLVENISNYSFFTGHQLINESQQQLEPALRFNPNTSQVARFIGAKTNTTPIFIDNLVRGYLGSLGMYGADAVDWFLTKTGLVDVPPPPAKSWREQPGIRAFFGSPYAPNEYNRRFYEAMALAETRLKTFGAYTDKSLSGEQRKFWSKNQNEIVWYNAGTGNDDDTVMTSLRRTQKEMGELGKAMIYVQNSRAIDPDTKRTRLIQLKDARDKLAEHAFRTYIHPTDRFKVY